MTVDLARRDAIRAAALAPLLLLLKGNPAMAGSAWTNELVDLIVLASQQAGFSGFFDYNPAPGFGNLALSVASVAAKDPDGNAYLAGFTTYGQSGGTFTALNLNGSLLTSYTAPGAGGPWTLQGQVFFNTVAGELAINYPNSEFNGSVAIDANLVVKGANATLNNSATSPTPVTAPSFNTLGSTWNATTATEANANFNQILTQLLAAGVWH